MYSRSRVWTPKSSSNTIKNNQQLDEKLTRALCIDQARERVAQQVNGLNLVQLKYYHYRQRVCLLAKGEAILSHLLH